MLSSFSCVCWQSVCLLWRNVYLGLPPIFGLGCLFFWYWAAWAACIVWRSILCQLLHLQIFSQDCPFLFFMVSFALKKLFFFLKVIFYFFKDFFLLIDWLIAMLGLRFCARAFSSCGKQGPLFIAVHGPLTIVASLVAEHRLQTRRLSICGSRAQLRRGMWDLPRPGLEPVSPALAGRFSTTVPPGKPWKSF